MATSTTPAPASPPSSIPATSPPHPKYQAEDDALITPRRQNTTSTKRRESYPRDGCHHGNTHVDNNDNDVRALNHEISQQPLQKEDEVQKQGELKLVEFNKPLDWDEARSRLRKTLERWDDERRSRRMPSFMGSSGSSASSSQQDLFSSQEDENNYERHSDIFTINGQSSKVSKFIPKFIRQIQDPDMVLLAIPLSLIFVILSFILPPLDLDHFQNHNVHESSHSKNDDNHFHKMQQSAAILFLLSSLISTWITRRRRKVSKETDGSIVRRRCVAKFLEGMEKRQEKRHESLSSMTFGEDDAFLSGSENIVRGEQTTTMQQQQSQSKVPLNLMHPDLYNVDVIPRKNVEDVYSIYRLGRSHGIQHGQNSQNAQQHLQIGNAKKEGEWHRIPSLLLVKGDFIALKVGDTAPAKCGPIHSWEAASNAGNNVTDSRPMASAPKIIEAGERLTVDSLSPLAKEALMPSSINNGNCNKGSILPTGRSTLKNRSEELLLLANGLQIYVLLETPLDSFLRRKDAAKHKTPQLIRQGLAIRRTFLHIAIISFTITTIFLLVRPDGARHFFQSSTWSLPLLAALSVLPVISPMYVFFLECIGTARILATVHPLASTQRNRTPYKVASDNGPGGGRGGGVGSVAGGLSTSDTSLPPETAIEHVDRVEKPPLRLLFRYMFATSNARLFTKSPMKVMTDRIRARKSSSSSTPVTALPSNVSNQSSSSERDALLSIPPASLHLLEKLGVVTALALIDDELACEPFSTPQQLLIPSGQGGLKLLDICPVFDDDDAYSSDDEDNETSNYPASSRNSITASRFNSRHTSDVYSIDSDDSNDETRYNHTFSAPARTLRKIRGRYRKRKRVRRALGSTGLPTGESGHRYGVDEEGEVEVQFEDPQWWQFLPSLKCIGLGCLLVEEGISSKENEATLPVNSQFEHVKPTQKVSFGAGKSGRKRNSRLLTPVETALVDHICQERERKQLRLLARCIGFDTTPNESGARGDLSCFHERRRLHIIATNLLRKRMQLESHSLGLEEGRNWSRLYSDATTVFVNDSRSGGDLVLTVGDARVITELCPDWWQGENSTISPLTVSDRRVIKETSTNWMLSDLDVVAFSYSPLPYTADHKIGWGKGPESQVFLMSNPSEPNAQTISGSAAGTGFWSLIKNQIFLGSLGSSVRPRKEIEPLIDACAKAGVRWVYFSPRNMRRTKELASQMGIDTAWNCAISLRPLEEGTDDTFRMTSNYADWDVNAKLPHGIEDVKRHLEEVDNVPLLVSLFTDVTKETTADMVNIFQDYHDTVLSCGLSHLPRNQEIFLRSDIAIGVDVLAEEVSFNQLTQNDVLEWNALLPDEVAFVTSISAYSSVFNLLGSNATCHLMEIIRIGRASLEAVTSAVGFVLSGYLSFSVFILLCPCTVATAVPIIPALGSFLYILLLLLIGSAIAATTDEDKGSMSRVPPKNDPSSKFSLKESKRIYTNGLLRAAPPAILPQFIYLIVLPELIWEFDSSFIEDHCLDYTMDESNPIRPSLADIIRCEAIRTYMGPAKVAAGTITLASLAICTCLSSASYVFRTEPIRSEPPWKRNRLWVVALILSFALIAIYLSIILEEGTMRALPAYFYMLFLVSPFICLFCSELVKKIDQKHEKRAVMMRRLQFETRLGMWSPKESTHMLEPVHANRSPIV